MKEVKVVIGKNFGDEGKGATVHRLCVGKQAVVVRHNGGAQAGHTVEADNFRFVFHQLGSGSLAGCHTFWNRTFLPDLLKLDEEVEGFRVAVKRLQTEGEDFRTKTALKIYAHPQCACTVIYDVLLNSLTEVLRGSAKHGSCGMGIYEATQRMKQEAYTLRLKDFADLDVAGVVEKMRRIRQEYTLPRLQRLRQEYGDAFQRPEVSQWVELIEDDNVLWNATEQMCENFHKYVELKDWQEIAAAHDTIVFENAQGLMLDRENEEYYPHLTPSHTGLHNVVALLREVAQELGQGIGELLEEAAGVSQLQQGVTGGMKDGSRTEQRGCSLEVLYVTRTYVTRHGMGRLDYECPKEAINPHMVDKTNVPNFWQDALRYARHPSGEEFWRYIRKDLQALESLKDFAKITTGICVNHLDETEGQVLFADGAMSLEAFREYCKEQGMDTVYA